MALLFNRRRLRTTFIATLILALPMSLAWQDSKTVFFLRAFVTGLAAMLAFGLAEQWPYRLPPWLARWALQVLAVALAIPLCTAALYVYGTEPGAPPFWREGRRVGGFLALTLLPLLVAPWIALAALVRQREAWAREQALAFELERSELARQALDARMRLLTAQVQPHFLFNTLANVHALVETGSPRAAPVLENLIEYLRAAVPRLDEGEASLGQELELVRAYLAVMQMRIPDRLGYALQIEPGLAALRCPPMCLLTLVENAVRHGIDPSEEGGRIDISARRVGPRYLLRVQDSGVGLRASGSGLGTGLKSLRERLTLFFNGDVAMHLRAVEPHGVCVELDLPAQEVAV
ncbi:signal transduction histidine kinase [Paucibacter oligotrophus]|uniref:Signal transduction histidine kinase n=1 Tax=Roseateles oligotrophus TaxID=1769250 RepID=A0A840L4Y4_9BURK|nr:histidine kinase [Roseateles oligotrophus]MBB4843056.1 signal transduction histidine kinase [Roseateles oligotrophus]